MGAKAQNIADEYYALGAALYDSGRYADAADTRGKTFTLYTNSGFIITNNIIRGNIAVLEDGLTIQNNLFYNAGTQSALQVITNCNVQNNIFYGCSPAVGATSTGNTFSNNMVFGSTNDTFPNGVNANVAVGNLVANPIRFVT